MKCYIVTRSFHDEANWEIGGFSYEQYPCGVYATLEEAVSYVRNEMYNPKYTSLNGIYYFNIYGMENNNILSCMVIPITVEDDIIESYINEYAKKYNDAKNMTTDEFINAYTVEIPISFEHRINLPNWN